MSRPGDANSGGTPTLRLLVDEDCRDADVTPRLAAPSNSGPGRLASSRVGDAGGIAVSVGDRRLPAIMAAVVADSSECAGTKLPLSAPPAVNACAGTNDDAAERRLAPGAT